MMPWWSFKLRLDMDWNAALVLHMRQYNTVVVGLCVHIFVDRYVLCTFVVVYAPVIELPVICLWCMSTWMLPDGFLHVIYFGYLSIAPCPRCRLLWIFYNNFVYIDSRVWLVLSLVLSGQPHRLTTMNTAAAQVLSSGACVGALSPCLYETRDQISLNSVPFPVAGRQTPSRSLWMFGLDCCL